MARVGCKMTRAAEFCYIAERQSDHTFLQVLMDVTGNGIFHTLWTKDPEMALRITWQGRASIVNTLTSGRCARKARLHGGRLQKGAGRMNDALLVVWLVCGGVGFGAFYKEARSGTGEIFAIMLVCALVGPFAAGAAIGDAVVRGEKAK